MSCCTAKRVEVFTAGCEICDGAVEIVNRLCKDCGCEIEVVDVNASAENLERAKAYGVKCLPSVVVDGKLPGCCTTGIDEATLRNTLQG